MRTRIILAIACLLLGSAGTSSAFIDAATAKKEQAKIEERKARDREHDAMVAKWWQEKAGIVANKPSIQLADYRWARKFGYVAGTLISRLADCPDVEGKDSVTKAALISGAQTSISTAYPGAQVDCSTRSGSYSQASISLIFRQGKATSFSKLGDEGITWTAVFGEKGTTLSANDNNGNTVSWRVDNESGEVKTLSAKLLVSYESGVGASTAMNTGRISHTKLPALIDLYHETEIRDKEKDGVYSIVIWLMKDPSFQVRFVEWAEGKFDQI